MSMWWSCCFCTGDSSLVVTGGDIGNWEVGGSDFPSFDIILGSAPPTAFGLHAQTTSGPVDRVSGFIRFNNVTIPNAATISSAKIVINEINHPLGEDAFVTPLGSMYAGGGTASCDIYCEDADDGTLPTTAAQADGLIRTTASVTGYAHDRGEYTAGDYVEITGLASLVQEVVNRAGWSSGNYLTFLFDEDGNSDSNASGTHQWGILATACDSAAGPPVSLYEMPELHVIYS